MTRTVFDNYQTAHVWAQQKQPYGRSQNGNLYFEGRAILSYGWHYVAGYALPKIGGGFLYLTNADSSSMTTGGKHMPAVYSAIGYHVESVAVPRLSSLARFLDAFALDGDTAQARRKRAFPALRRELVKCWPGERGAALILAAMGDKRPEQSAVTMARRVARGIEKRKARELKEEQDRLARLAKQTAAMPLSEFRRACAVTLGEWTYPEGAIRALGEKGKAIHRQAKEAKRRGWTQVAAACRARYKIAREFVTEGESRFEFARRHAARRRAIHAYRRAVSAWQEDSAALVAFDPATLSGHVLPGQARAALMSQAAHAARRVASTARDLRNLDLPRVDTARLELIESGAKRADSQLRENMAAARYDLEREARDAWRNGDAGQRYARGMDCPQGGAMLRASGVERDAAGQIIGGELQTSHGARVPLTHALRVFRFLKLCRDKGQAWQANGKTLRVGHFAVDSVAASGDFVAGCHRIYWKEVERLAASLGVLDIAPTDTTERRDTVAA